MNEALKLQTGVTGAAQRLSNAASKLASSGFKAILMLAVCKASNIVYVQHGSPHPLPTTSMQYL
eukprot:4402592-Amphidinium_carterae.2